MELLPIQPFGVEVVADIGHGFSPAEQELLRESWSRAGLLVFRNARLSMEKQIELCSVFGPTLPLGHPENYLVSNVHPEGFLGTQELLFHNDIPFVPVPYPGGSLHAVDVEPGVSSTRYASGYLAYGRLPSALQDRISGLRALQVRKRRGLTRTRLSDLVDGDPAAVHSVVGHHRETGQPYLFVNEDMTDGMIGMTGSESDLLLEELFGLFYTADNIYEHDWRPGDVVLWDNLAIQHARAALSSPAHRTLQRVTIATFGLYDQNPSALDDWHKKKSVNEGAKFEPEIDAAVVA